MEKDSAKKEPSALQWKPQFDKALYRCVVDGKFLLKKFHLSGVLLLRKMPDASTRVVFQNEMGLSFFDFEWNTSDSFHVNRIMEQMDKPALVKTLQKDFELLLMKKLDSSKETIYHNSSSNDEQLFRHQFPLSKGHVYYQIEGKNLTNIVNYGKQKVVSMTLRSTRDSTLSSSVFIRHHKARFSIQLTRISNADAD